MYNPMTNGFDQKLGSTPGDENSRNLATNDPNGSIANSSYNTAL